MKLIEIESPKEEKQPENDPREEGWVDWEYIPKCSLAVKDEKQRMEIVLKTDASEMVYDNLVQIIRPGGKFKPIPSSAITPMKIDREWYEKNIGPVE